MAADVMTVKLRGMRVEFSPMLDGENGVWVVHARIRVAGNREFALMEHFFEDDLRSRFDILWQAMGERLKAHAIEGAKIPT